MKKHAAILLAMTLALLFCLPAAAAPSQDEMDGTTPYGLTAEAIPGENGAALLSFQVVALGADLPGMEPGDDIYTKVEYKRGEEAWQSYNAFGSQEMLEEFQRSSGEFQLRVDWMDGNGWDGEEPVYFRVYCEYFAGAAGTGLVSQYSEVAYIGVAGEGWTEPTTIGIVPIPYEEAELAQDAEEPVALPDNLGVSYGLLVCLGFGLLLLVIIIVIVVISRKRKRA